MTSAKFWDFWTLSPLSAFGTDIQDRIHETSLTTSAFRLRSSPSAVRTSFKYASKEYKSSGPGIVILASADDGEFRAYFIRVKKMYW